MHCAHVSFPFIRKYLLTMLNIYTLENLLSHKSSCNDSCVLHPMVAMFDNLLFLFHFVSIAWCSILFIFICLFVSTYIWSCDRCSLHLEGEQVVNIQEQDFQDAATTKHYRRQASLSFWYPIYHWYILHTCVITHKDFIGCTISLVSWGIWRIINA